MISIGFLLIDGFALMSYSSVIEPLRAANLLSEKKLYKIINFSLNRTAKSSSDAIIDAQLTMVNDKNQVKIISWYDNEYAYSLRLLELCQHIIKQDFL